MYDLQSQRGLNSISEYTSTSHIPYGFACCDLCSFETKYVTKAVDSNISSRIYEHFINWYIMFELYFMFYWCLTFQNVPTAVQI